MNQIYSNKKDFFAPSTTVWKKRRSDGSAVRRRNVYNGQIPRRRIDGSNYTDRSSGVWSRRSSGASEIRYASSRGANSIGKKKFGESRLEAAERRRTVAKRKGFRLFALCSLIFIALIFLVYKLLFIVGGISIEGSQRYGAEEIVSASGLSDGVNLYSFRSSVVKSRITFACPYISEVDLSRNIPDKVTISVKEETPAYIAEIYGEDVLLSESLRTLGKSSDEDNADNLNLIRITLPDVKEAVSGRTLSFFDSKSDKDSRSILSAVSDSELAGRINSIDARDQYDVDIVCDGKYLLSLGSTDNIALKLKTAAKVLEDDMFSGEDKARIDLKTAGKTSVMIDNKLDLD